MAISLGTYKCTIWIQQPFKWQFLWEHINAQYGFSSHLNGNFSGNTLCHCNEGSLYFICFLIIISKYPKWLEDNKDNKDVTADMSNYRKQHELITVIIGEFEAEKETDTDEVKSKRFEKIMDLMQQVG